MFRPIFKSLFSVWSWYRRSKRIHWKMRTIPLLISIRRYLACRQSRLRPTPAVRNLKGWIHRALAIRRRGLRSWPSGTRRANPQPPENSCSRRKNLYLSQPDELLWSIRRRGRKSSWLRKFVKSVVSATQTLRPAHQCLYRGQRSESLFLNTKKPRRVIPVLSCLPCREARRMRLRASCLRCKLSLTLRAWRAWN